MTVKSTAATKLRRWIAGSVLALATLAVLPQAALAWPTKYTSCSSCHTGTEPTATVSVALNGVAGTTITVAPGATFEIDWIVRNISGSGRMGMELAVPTGWTVATGTANAPALAGWNNVWNLTAGEFWWATSYSTAAEFPSSPVGYTINFDGPSWDSGTRNAAMDDATAMDLDGTANTMGTDARITVPGGTPNGTYTIQLTGAGHDTGGAKAFKTQAITVTVSGGDSTAPVPGTVTVSPQSGTFVPAAFTITTAFTDAESAVTSCQYTLNGVAWSAGTVSGAGPYTCTASISGQTNGSGLTINMRATSLGGTGTATQISRTVDAAAPTTTSNAPAGWQAADVNVTLTPTDGTGSGVASTQYCVDTTNTCTPGTSGTAVSVTQVAGTAGTQYVRFRSTDNLSNVETVKSATVQIDKAVPADGTLSASPSNSQVGLSWTVASDTGSGLRAANTYDLRFLTGATPPTCATGTSIYTGTGTSYTHTGLTNGTQYSYRLCAYDNVNNASAGATASATPSAVCTASNPTVTILAPNKQITSGGGSVVYTVEVTNNDSVDCSSTTFSLSRNDSNATSFQASVLGSGTLLVAPGATGSTTLTVTATASPINGATNNTTVSTAAAGPHGAVTSPAITTLINLTRTPTMYYNIGETVHFEYRSSTRFVSQGAGALSLYSSTGAIIQANLNMLETQVGATWVYTYDWSTAAQPADAYRVKIWDSSDTIPAANGMIVLGNSTKKLNLYADAGYTTPTDIFAQGATVYAEVLLPSPETGTTQTDLSNWYDAPPATPVLTVTETGTRFRFNFVADFATASINNGDWGWFYWLGQATGIEFHRPIQRNDAGCGSCTRSTPTVTLVTANQTITSDGGSADYTLNVTNNDTVSCGPTSFDLVAVDSNLTNFNASTFGADPLAVGPGLTGSTVMTVSAKPGQPNGSTNNSAFYTAADGNHAASANSATRTTTISVADVTAPVVTAFNVPATSTSWTIPVSTFTATDAIGVTGYKITESAVAPLPGDAGWTASAPATYVTASDSAAKVLYAWAKDAAGNVSASLSDTINVDATKPVVTDFTMPATSTSLTVPITQFLATDGIGVTGYKVTTSATAPLPGDAGWTAGAPASYVVAASATYTFYPWAKDALGNVSLVFGAPATVVVDTVAPSVASTVPASAATGVVRDSSVTINFSEPVDCGTVTATNIVSDSPAWAYDGTSCIASGGSQAIFTTSGQAYATTYNVSVTSGVRDLVGNPLSPAPYNFAFTTEAEPCVRSTPTVSIVTANQNAVVDGDLVNYVVSIVNTDTGACGNTIFSLVAVDSDAVSFDPSTFDTATISLAPSTSGTRNLRVKAKAGALNGASNDTYFYTAADGNHAQSLNSGVATTVIAVPCNVAPDVAITTASQSIITDGGSAAYTVQVTNNNALACGTTAFDLVVVDDNGVAFAIPSVFTADPLSVAPGGASNTTTLTVNSQTGAANFSANNTYFYTALNGTIPRSANSNAVTTTLNRPCVRNAPGFSAGVNKTIPLAGTAVYTLTIVNNDVDCTPTTFNLSIFSETGNTTAFTLPSTLSAATANVAAGATGSSVTLTVVGNGTGSDGNNLTSTVRVSSANHAAVSTAPVTTLRPISPLIHNSYSTASTKHLAQGGWGVVGGKYGEFTCATCHTPSTSNVKRVVATLPNAPDTSKGNFPGAGQAVVLLDTREGSSHFGDDTASHATSNRICEVCHTYDPTDPRDDGVKQHAYNMPVTASHYNKSDCVNCHKHSSGFDASGGACDSCHGYPPTAADGKAYQATEGKGAHLKHVNHLAAKAGITLDPNADSFGDANTTKVCGVCHDMNAASHEMGGGTRNINFFGAATFQFGGSAPVYNGTQGQPSSVDPKTCSNVNCHFQATPWWE
ncbi:MAG: hypothetical protein FDZ69_09265 [Deltaproteobacteria bacterium]|nr:MAG: hypothetical protein FDZ69_09265 [Deltaproteobacteria bacterium]